MKTLNARRLIHAVGGKALFIPKDGWRATTFRLFGQAMIVAMHRAALITQRQQTALVARAVAAQFKKQIEEVIQRFLSTSTFGRSAKAPGDVFLPAHEQLLLEILNDVLEETGARVTAEILPSVQSTLDQGYSKTSMLLAQRPVRGSIGLQRRSQALASRITNISATTRRRFQTILNNAVREGLSIQQTAQLIRQRIPQIQANRALTIARTEINNAWREGAIQSFKESATLTLVSVIGCESREEDRWETPSYAPYLYRGESTCNIQDVPVADSDKLEFHINHTGTLVPSGFIE